MHDYVIFLIREGEDPEISPEPSPGSSESGAGEDPEATPEIAPTPSPGINQNENNNIQTIESVDYTDQLTEMQNSFDRLETGIFALIIIFSALLLYMIISDLFRGAKL